MHRLTTHLWHITVQSVEKATHAAPLMCPRWYRQKWVFSLPRKIFPHSRLSSLSKTKRCTSYCCVHHRYKIKRAMPGGKAKVQNTFPKCVTYHIWHKASFAYQTLLTTKPEMNICPVKSKSEASQIYFFEVPSLPNAAPRRSRCWRLPAQIGANAELEYRQNNRPVAAFRSTLLH